MSSALQPMTPRACFNQQHAQRELHRQREMVANLRAENALLRNKYQSKLEEQNDVLEDKHTQRVGHLMNLKFEIEEQVWCSRLKARLQHIAPH